MEECTPQYLGVGGAVVREEYLGWWICGLCGHAQAAGDEIRRVGAGEATTAEALDRHVPFACATLSAPTRAAVDVFVAAVTRLLRRSLTRHRSLQPQPPPQGRKVAAGPDPPATEITID
uniref:Uncharacterized protein n=1 Tax=Oryza punctata TaxID=4537 RepID=A0A0E0KI92_ORYPU